MFLEANEINGFKAAQRNDKACSEATNLPRQAKTEKVFTEPEEKQNLG
jgi:hypothetical protein